MTIEKSTKDQEIIQNLWSTNEKTVLDTIKRLRKEGNNTFLLETIKLYIKSKSKELKGAIHNLWCDIQVQESKVVLEEAIKNKDFASIKKDLLSACWQSKLNFNTIDLFIDSIIEDDFETAVEAYSCIDNNLDFTSKENIKLNYDKLKNSFSEIHPDKKEFVKQLIFELETEI